MQSVEGHTLFYRTFPSVKTTSGFVAVMIISINWLPFLAPTLDNAELWVGCPSWYQLLIMLIGSGDNNMFLSAPRRDGGSKPASGSLYAIYI